MAELQVRDASGNNLAKGKTVTALDSIEAPPAGANQPRRWTLHRPNRRPGLGQAPGRHRGGTRRLINSIIKGVADKRNRAQAALAKSEAAMKALPKPQRVYVGKVHTGGGAFRGTGHEGGKPRTIRVLHRGDMSQPGRSRPRHTALDQTRRRHV